MKKIAAFSVLFLIVCGAVAFFLLPDRQISEFENRALAQAPAFTASRYLDASLRTETEDYVADQFPLRDLLLSFYRKRIKRRSALPGENYREAIESEDGYDYYIFDENLILYPYVWKKSAAEADLFADFMRETGDLCSEKGVDLFLDLVPSKVESLHDLLPAGAEPTSDLSLLNGIRGKLPENCLTIPTMDVFASISAEEKSAFYYHTDHHWNARGANLAFKVLCESLQKAGFSADYNALGYTESLLPEKPFWGSYNRNLGLLYSTKEELPLYTPRAGLREQLTWETRDGAPFVYAAGAENENLNYGALTTYDLPYIHVHNENAPNDYSVCVIKDSFYNAVSADLPLLFRDVYTVDPRYWEDFSVRGILEELKPDGLLFFYCSSLLYKTTETITYPVE